MKNSNLRSLQLRQLTARLEPLAPLRSEKPPADGWIRAIRRALGMTTTQLARRLSISQSAATLLEGREAAMTVSLETLNRAADALECDLVYALIPRVPLAEMRARAANAAAWAQFRQVDHSMGLEDQAVAGGESQFLADEEAQDLLRSWSNKIWDAPATEA
jgi:predicted DNA-binding mobile mystery protein A